MEAEERTAFPSTQAHSEDPTSQTSIFSAFATYSFDTDTEFQAGLASILGHPATPATRAETESNPDLVLQAQCFYYARKFNTPSINPTTYLEWKKTTSKTSENNTLSNASESTTAQPTNSENLPPPPYPTSFAAIVELITNNKPIPGIEEVPDTVLQHGSSKQDTVQRRRKPWEKDNAEVTPASAPSTRLGTEPVSVDQFQVHGNENEELAGSDVEEDTDLMERARRTGVGVMHILSPNAVPDSGLVAKE